MTYTGALKDNRYYIMESRDPDRMLLYSMPELPQENHDSWMFGQPFTEGPTTPIEVEIQERYLNAKLLPYFGNPPSSPSTSTRRSSMPASTTSWPTTPKS